MASELRVNTLKDASGNNSVATSVVFGGTAKGWVNLNGTSTAANRDSFNFDAVTDNGTGDYTHTITNNMNNATYAITTGTNGGNAANNTNTFDIFIDCTRAEPTTAAFPTQNWQDNATTGDVGYVMVAIHGDLA